MGTFVVTGFVAMSFVVTFVMAVEAT